MADKLAANKPRSGKAPPPDSLFITLTDALERDTDRRYDEERGEEMQDLGAAPPVPMKSPRNCRLSRPAMRQGSLIPELEEPASCEQSPDYQVRYQQYRDHTHDQRHLSGLLESMSSSRLRDQEWEAHV